MINNIIRLINKGLFIPFLEKKPLIPTWVRIACSGGYFYLFQGVFPGGSPARDLGLRLGPGFPEQVEYAYLYDTVFDASVLNRGVLRSAGGDIAEIA